MSWNCAAAGVRGHALARFDALQKREAFPIAVRLGPRRRPLLGVVPTGEIDSLFGRHEIRCQCCPRQQCGFLLVLADCAVNRPGEVSARDSSARPDQARSGSSRGARDNRCQVRDYRIGLALGNGGLSGTMTELGNRCIAKPEDRAVTILSHLVGSRQRAQCFT